MPEHTPAPTPSRSVYGFVLLLSAKTLFLVFLIWGLIPRHIFEQVNITYLPQRYWAISIPIFLLTFLAMFAFIIYPSLNLCMTPSVDDMVTVFDRSNMEKSVNKRLNSLHDDNYEVLDNECICKQGEICVKKDYMKVQRQFHTYNIPVLEDMDIAEVSRKLYLK